MLMNGYRSNSDMDQNDLQVRRAQTLPSAAAAEGELNRYPDPAQALDILPEEQRDVWHNKLRSARGAGRVDVLLDLGRALQYIDPHAALAQLRRARQLLADGSKAAARGTRSLRRHLAQEARGLRLQGAIEGQLGRSESAQALLEQARDQYQVAKDVEGEVRALLELADLQQGDVNDDEVLVLLERCRDISEAQGQSENLAGALCLLAKSRVKAGKFDEALDIYRRSLELNEKAGHHHGTAQTYEGRAYLFWCRGDYSAALEAYRKSLSIKEALGYRAGLSGILNSVGVMLQLLGDHGAAQDHYYRALHISEDLDLRAGIAISLRNLGVSDTELNENEKALGHMQRSLAINEALGNRSEQVRISNNIGNVHKALENFSESIEWYRRCLELAESIQDTRGAALALGNIGQTFVKQGEYRQGEPYLKRGLALFEELNEPWGIAIALVTLGHLYFESKQAQAALKVLHRAVDLASEVNASELLSRAHHLIAEVYNLSGDHAAAFRHYRSFHELYKKMYSEESDKRVRNLQIRHDLAQREKEAEIIRLRNAELAAKVESQQKELTAKALYLSQKNDLLLNLKKELKALSGHTVRNDRQALNSVVDNIDSTLNDEQGWDVFEAQFQSVHPDFVHTLTTMYPRLTPTEVKVCALIMLKLSSKESARILNISGRSVGEYRYRIRKKLGLDGEENLTNFLARLSAQDAG